MQLEGLGKLENPMASKGNEQKNINFMDVKPI
jgi:hypothetical protein